MSSEEINDFLKSIDTEDAIWIVYLFIIFLSYYSNNLERKAILENDTPSKNKYYKIIIFIFAVLTIIYIYFLKESYKSLKNLKENDTAKRKELVTVTFIASLLVALSGILFLYAAIKNDNLDVEIAFN